jgi:hypothetical protein
MEPARKIARIEPQSWMTAPHTRAVLAALSAEGAAPRFVGGCVRDAELGRPVKDIDIATPDPPERVLALLERAGLKAVPTGLAHGTVTAISRGRPFEVTSLRIDVETYGRHAKVEFTDDWQADAGRRDLTINALSCAPDGRIFDYFGGLEDLRAGRVRFVGDPRARIREDYLRLLRFFRFHAHYGRGAPDPEGLAAAGELAPKATKLSGERVRAELLRLLAAPDPVPVLDLMAARGVLRVFLPEAADTAALARRTRRPWRRRWRSNRTDRRRTPCFAWRPCCRRIRRRATRWPRDCACRGPSRAASWACWSLPARRWGPARRPCAPDYTGGARRFWRTNGGSPGRGSAQKSGRTAAGSWRPPWAWLRPGSPRPSP